MFRFSNEHVQAIEAHGFNALALRIATELPDHMGPALAQRSPEGILGSTKIAIAKARHHKIEDEDSLFQFCQLSVSLGTYFWEDRQLPWARAILEEQSYLDATERMTDLWNAAMDFMNAANFGEAWFPKNVFEAYLARPPVPSDTDTNRSAALNDLRSLWPEKFDHLGHDLVAYSMAAATERAAGYVQSAEDQWCFCRLTWLLGFAFEVSPLSDWLPDPHGAERGRRYHLRDIETACEKHLIVGALRAS